MEKSRTGLTCPVRQLFHTILAFYIGILMILKMRRNQGSRIHAVISKMIRITPASTQIDAFSLYQSSSIISIDDSGKELLFIIEPKVTIIEISGSRNGYITSAHNSPGDNFDIVICIEFEF